MPDVVLYHDGIEVSRRTVTFESAPSSGDDPTAWGYRPPVPAGWAVVDGQTVSVPDNAQRRYYRNCKISAYVRDAAADLIFVDCDMYGGTFGTQGRNIRAYGCRMGGRVTTDDKGRDAAQIKPSTSGGTRPSGWVIQGCSILDVTRTTGASGHTDGIQFGGCLDMIVRHCRFENIHVEHILCNGWNGNPENVLIEGCYFGSRPEPGGPPVHFSSAGNYSARNCRAVGNFHDGPVASIETGTVGCSESGTRSRSEWTHGDPWMTY